MDYSRTARLIRAVRLEQRLSQSDVARRAGLSQQTLSRLEQGDIGPFTIRSLEAVSNALGIALELRGRWQGDRGDRLLDREHAALVGVVVDVMRGLGWEIIVEYSFNQFGERGSVDVVGWHPQARTLLVVEVKSRIVDLQDMLSTMDRKARLVPSMLASERGWHARQVGLILVLPARSGTREAVIRHRAILGAVLPGRTIETQLWLKEPSRAFRGIWFVRDTRTIGRRKPTTGPGGGRATRSASNRADSGPQTGPRTVPPHV